MTSVPSTTRSLAARSNVRIVGTGERTLMFAHGFCSNQDIFSAQVEAFRESHRVVTYDLTGFGQSDPQLWQPTRYATLDGYAHDIVELIEELDLRNVTFVGASLSAMAGLKASLARPERFDALVFVAGSPRYLNDGWYVGGFDRAALDGFYALVDQAARSDWQDAVTGMMLNQPVSLALQDVARAVRGVTPDVASVVARAIFESDDRSLLSAARHPVLVVQTRADAAVPEAVGKYMAGVLPDAELVFLPGVGHIPMRTEPEAFNAAVRTFLARQDDQAHGS